MRAPRRALAVLSVASLLVGCTVLPDAPRRLGTCGIAMAIWMTHPTDARYEYFRIDDGKLHYGGGRDALMLKTSWSTPLTAEQCAAVRELVLKAGWLSPEMSSSETEKNEATASVAIAWDEGRCQFRLAGGAPSVVAVVEYLEVIARTRFKPSIDRLPEAGPQK